MRRTSIVLIGMLIVVIGIVNAEYVSIPATTTILQTQCMNLTYNTDTILSEVQVADKYVLLNGSIFNVTTLSGNRVAVNIINWGDSYKRFTITSTGADTLYISIPYPSNIRCRVYVDSSSIGDYVGGSNGYLNFTYTGGFSTRDFQIIAETSSGSGSSDTWYPTATPTKTATPTITSTPIIISPKGEPINWSDIKNPFDNIEFPNITLPTAEVPKSIQDDLNAFSAQYGVAIVMVLIILVAFIWWRK